MTAALLFASSLHCGKGDESPPSGGAAVSGSASEPLPISDEQVIRRFTDLWRSSQQIMFNRFLGVRTLQNPLDVWITQEILFQVRPEFVVETGTYKGGSAVLWAVFLEHIEPGARVITIDIEDQRSNRAKTLPIAKRSVEFLLGSSVDPKVVAQVEERVRGKKVLVILDSLHTPEHVLAELRAYGPMVSVGSYMIVQDTPIGLVPAIDEFLAENHDFEVDPRRERLMLSNNEHGYLKRVR